MTTALAPGDLERLLHFVAEAESFGGDHPFEGEFLTQLGRLVPALETAHALAALPRILAGTEGAGSDWAEETVVLIGFSGRGDKDLAPFGRWIEAHGS